MGLLRSSLELLVPERKSSALASTIPTWLNHQPQVPAQSYERFAREGYQRNELVFACVECLATSVAEPRFAAYRKTGRGKEPEQIEDHPILDLLENPNPFMSRSLFFQTMMMHRAIAGNVFIEKVRSRKGVSELWLWRPDRVKIIPDSKKYIGSYQVTVGSDVFELPPQDMIHYKTRSALDDFYGMPPMQPIANRVDTDNYMREFTRSFFTNAGVPAGLLNLQRKVGESEREMMRARFRQDYAGPSGWHNLMIFDGSEATYTAMGLPMGDRGLAMSDLDEIMEARICMGFQVPLSVAGTRLGLTKGSQASRDSDRRLFWTSTLVPMFREIAASLNTGLVPEYRDVTYIDFDMEDVKELEEDRNEFHARVRADFVASIIPRGQAAKLLGYAEPDPDDTYFVSSTMIPEPVTPAPEPPPPTVSGPPQLPPPTNPAQVEGEPIPKGEEAQPGGGIGAGEGNTQAGKTLDAKARHDYATTSVVPPPAIAILTASLSALIHDDDLTADGREASPHVTVLYGLHGDDPRQVKNALAGEKPAHATFAETSIFPSSETGKNFDVVKVTVDSEDLHRLNQKLSSALSHTDTHPAYHPHLTIAYVKPGKGAKYAGLTVLKGKTARFDHVLFSDHDGKQTAIPLGSGS